VRGRGLRPVRVEGTSMLPTLPPGARLAVAPLRAPPRRGQLVIVSTVALPPVPGRPPEFVKRVVGLPGEHVRLDAEGLWVDGRRCPGPGAAAPDASFALLLREGQYLVLGDHRGASTDGRTIGPVRLDDFDGIVRFVYWPLRSLMVTFRDRWRWRRAGRTLASIGESGGQRQDWGGEPTRQSGQDS
jgi:signal peptidase I